MVLSEVSYIRNNVSKGCLSEFVGTLTLSNQITKFYYINLPISIGTVKTNYFQGAHEALKKVKTSKLEFFC